jgi:hypothetical protein
MNTVAQKAGTAHFTVDAGPVLDPDLEKMSTALNVIAGYALTQRRLAMMLSGRDVDEQFKDDVMNAVEILSITIGGLADELSGNNIYGSSHRWHFGPSFERQVGGTA